MKTNRPSKHSDHKRLRTGALGTVFLGLVAALVLVATSVYPRGGEAATAPTLGAALSYSVIAGSIVTNTGATTMNRNLGISPSIGVPPHYTNFPPGIVGPPGVIHDADAHAALAQAADTAAFGTLDQLCDTTYAGVQDLTLVSPLGAGVYCADAFLLTGNLTLSGSGVWIFKSAATLTTSSGSSVTGGDPCNIWWRLVSSGTLGSGTSFRGNILALTSISMNTGATLNGRAFAQTGAVTLQANTISSPNCAAVPPTDTPTPISTSVPTSTPGPDSTGTPLVPGTGTPGAPGTGTPSAPGTGTPPGAAPPRGPLSAPPTGDAGLLQRKSGAPIALAVFAGLFLIGAVALEHRRLKQRS